MSIEAALITPAFILFLLLIIALARVEMARQDIHAAVVQAARVASLQDNSIAGHDQAIAAATATLDREGVTCTSLKITVDAAALDQPPGVPGQTHATIVCVVPLSDVSVPGLPGSITITQTFAAQIDTYVDR